MCFFFNHISKCSGPPSPILFDQSLSKTCQISLLFVFWTVGGHDFAKKFEMYFVCFWAKQTQKQSLVKFLIENKLFWMIKKIRFYNSRQIGCLLRREVVYNKALSFFITAKYYICGFLAVNIMIS